MNKNFIFLCGIALTSTLISCGNNEEKTTATTTTVTDTVPTSTDVSLATPNSNNSDLASLPGDAQPGVQSVSASSTNVKLNPAHGEPGHDCALPVGAPLKGAGEIQENIKITSPAGQNVTPAAAPSKAANTNVKINPAHGEPGHDCAKPVGSPL